LEIKQNKKNY